MQTNNMQHVDFPIPTKTDKPISGYISHFNDKSWQLHGIQRNDTTWSKDDYRNTIQSIFSNILISPFVGSLQDDGITVCLLDGGHRTLAMKRFMENEFKAYAPTSGELCFYKDLPPRDKQAFDNHRPINTVIYTGLSKAQEELLFFRLNIGLPLSTGETVRAYHTIPMCALASKLADEYATRFMENVGNMVTKDNTRQDAASWILSILQNFHEGKLVITQRMTPPKQVENIIRCERYRGVAVNEEQLRKQMTFLMSVVDSNNNFKKLRTYIVPTIQGIMIKYPAMTRDNIIAFLSNMNGTNSDESMKALINDWNLLSVMDNTPGAKEKCNNRVEIFDRWRIMKST